MEPMRKIYFLSVDPFIPIPQLGVRPQRDKIKDSKLFLPSIDIGVLTCYIISFPVPNRGVSKCIQQIILSPCKSKIPSGMLRPPQFC